MIDFGFLLSGGFMTLGLKPSIYQAAGIFMLAVGIAQSANAAGTAKGTRIKMLGQFGQVPLSFEANQGQTSASVRYLAKGSGYGVFFTSTGTVLKLQRKGVAGESESVALGMGFSGANANPQISGLEPSSGRANYFVGSDPERWVTDVRLYGRVAYKDLYPGIDLVYYGNQRQLEHDFIVAPGADPARIRMKFDGVQNVAVDKAGDLVLTTAFGEVRHRKPIIYQEVGGKRKPIAGRFHVAGGEVGFTLARYDRRKPLVIDPVLLYSTLLGGSGTEAGADVVVDSQGAAYLVGNTSSTDFPVTVSSGGVFRGGTSDIFITKFAAAGSSVLFSTTVGGSGADTAARVAIDADGNVYVGGSTDSPNFPVTSTAAQGIIGGLTDAFLLKLDAAGVRSYATFLGGFQNEFLRGLAIDANRNIIVVGQTGSTNFPATTLGFFFGGGVTDAFVTKYDTNGVRAWTGYLGGIGVDAANAVAVDSNNDIYITGNTSSVNFPITAGVVQGAPTGNFANTSDAFVTKLAAAGTILYSTFLGGSQYDEGFAIGTDAGGNVYVAGDTDSTNFVTAGPIQGGSGGPRDGFVAKLNATGTLRVYAAYLGGAGSEHVTDAIVDSTGSLYVIGSTNSANFPVNNFVYGAPFGGLDAFVTRINPGGTARSSSSYLGGVGDDVANGIALDTAGNVYVAGVTSSTNLPTINPLQASLAGASDAFLSKISFCEVTISPLSASVGTATTIGTILVSAAADCQWNATTQSSFLTVQPATGLGNGVVSYSVAANAGGPRTGTIFVGGQTFTLTQAGTPVVGCVYPPTPAAVIVLATGETGTFSFETVSSICAWSAVSSAPWLQVFPLTGTGPATISYTAFPNFTTQVRSATVTIGAQSFSVTQFPNVLTANERFVQFVYSSFLGRIPSSTELASQVAALQAGTTRTDFINNFYNSLEFNQGGLFIAGLYIGLLGRDAEFGGWLFQRNALAKGQVTQLSLVQNFINSQEFTLKYGPLTNEAFVTLLYTNILRRVPTGPEVTFQAQAVNALGRTTVANGFLNSTEFRQNFGGRIAAFLLYATLLQRDASPTELTFRESQLNLGTATIRDLVSQFISSTEFQVQF